MTLRELVSLVFDLPDKTLGAKACLIGFAVIWRYGNANGPPTAQQPRPTSLTLRPDRPSVRYPVFSPLAY